MTVEILDVRRHKENGPIKGIYVKIRDQEGQFPLKTEHGCPDGPLAHMYLPAIRDQLIKAGVSDQEFRVHVTQIREAHLEACEHCERQDGPQSLSALRF